MEGWAGQGGRLGLYPSWGTGCFPEAWHRMGVEEGRQSWARGRGVEQGRACGHGHGGVLVTLGMGPVCPDRSPRREGTQTSPLPSGLPLCWPSVPRGRAIFRRVGPRIVLLLGSHCMPS